MPLPHDGQPGRGVGLGTADSLTGWLRAQVAGHTGRAPRDVDTGVSFARQGLDSLRATTLMATLSELLGRRLSPTLLWAHPTIEALTAHLLTGDAAAPAAGTGHRSGPSTNPDRHGEPVAVIGLGCRLPKADGPGAFWRLLREGTDAVGPAPAGRWAAAVSADPDTAASVSLADTEAGFLDRPIDGFDPLFFGISPREAEEMDPQQRLFLEVAWEALEDAGLANDGLRGTRTGVFVGAIWRDFADLAGPDPARISSHSATGRALNMVANRLSYVLGLRGPSVVLDSACSSSLLAVHLACQSLWSGESSVALAGGVNLMLNPATMLALARFGGLSPDGRCKAFAAAADGFGRGEGAGVVVLKPLSRALADADDIWCTIRGSAVNNDGFSNGLTAPNPTAQKEVLADACRRAGVAPGDVQFVETHGTGTVLGDPIEADALGAVLGGARPAGAPLVIGSVKTNLGHLEGAAGIAGLIKVALCLRHRQIPPNLHFDTPNPHIRFDELNLRVPTGLEPWPADRPLLAGVSSFGWGGTNVHVLLEGWREPDPLPALPAAGSAPGPSRVRPPVAFVCSPFGHQWHGMARNLYRTEPNFRAVLRRCDTELARYTGWSLVEELFADRAPERAADVDVMQPVLFAIQVGLAAWLESRGVRPDAVAGHSLGEIAAAVIAGILDIPAAARLVYHYSRHQRRIAGLGGGMAVVELAADQAERLLAGGYPGVVVAARNGPRSTALAGEVSTLERILAELKSRGVLCALIRVNVAAHSPAIDAVAWDLESDLAGLVARPGRLPMISTVTGLPVDWREIGPGYFVRNLREQVRLADATGHLLSTGHGVLVEISANPVLVPALRQSVADSGRPAVVLGTMRRADDDRDGLVEMLDALAATGVNLAGTGRPTGADHRAETGAEPGIDRHVDPDVDLDADQSAASGEDPDADPPDGQVDDRGDGRGDQAELFTLSAATSVALREFAGRMAGAIDAFDAPPAVRDLCGTAARRSRHRYRLAGVARSAVELSGLLAAYGRGEDPAGLAVSARAVESRPRVAFVFPGQGSQWVGMGRRLLRCEPVFAAAIRECDAAAGAFVDWSLAAELRAGRSVSRFDRIDVVQPVLFAVQVALAALWRSWGVEPDAVVGHSMGEVAAAHVAGALSLPDATRIMCLRSRLMRRASGQGAMLAVELSMDDARRAVHGHREVVSVAVNNSPRSTVLSGDTGALAEIARELESAQVFCRWVKVDVASHSPQMDRLRDDLVAALDGIGACEPSVPIHSTVTGGLVGADDLDVGYWVDNLRRPVLFADQVAGLIGAGVAGFVEVSPHPILLPAIGQVAAHTGSEVVAVPSLRRDEPERDSMLTSLGDLYAAGVPVDLGRAIGPGRTDLKLPGYPWQRERHWPRAFTVPPSGGRSGPDQHPLLGSRLDSAVEPDTHYWQPDLDAGVAGMGDHRIGGAAIVPGAAYLEMAVAAVGQVSPGEPHAVSDLCFREPLVIPDRGRRRIQVVLTGPASLRALRVFTDGEDLACTAEATVSPLPPDRSGATEEELDPPAVQARMTERVDGADYYRLLAARGLHYGPAFRCVTWIARTGTESLARLDPTSPGAWADRRYRVFPPVLDAAMQAVLAPALGPGWGEGTTEAFLTERVDRVIVPGWPTGPSGPVWAHAVVRPGGDDRRFQADLTVAGPDGVVVLVATGITVVRLAYLPVAGSAGAADPGDGAVADPVPAMPDGPRRRAAVEPAVRQIVARVVRLPEHRVDRDRPLRTLGIDSVMSLELRNRLEAAFGVRLSATLIWNYPTVREVARYLADRLGLDGDESPTGSDRRPPEHDPGGPGDLGDLGDPGGAALADGLGPSGAADLLERELSELNRRVEAI
ncbi:MAG TPA: acyltransferase domain-containing protein [Mycobacteriales bacterium]|nr:acyltransferase domain-containing protein [Mycobacteriales bacterium]